MKNIFGLLSVIGLTTMLFYSVALAAGGDIGTVKGSVVLGNSPDTRNVEIRLLGSDIWQKYNEFGEVRLAQGEQHNIKFDLRNTDQLYMDPAGNYEYSLWSNYKIIPTAVTADYAGKLHAVVIVDGRFEPIYSGDLAEMDAQMIGVAATLVDDNGNIIEQTTTGITITLSTIPSGFPEGDQEIVVPVEFLIVRAD